MRKAKIHLSTSHPQARLKPIYCIKSDLEKGFDSDNKNRTDKSTSFFKDYTFTLLLPTEARNISAVFKSLAGPACLLKWDLVSVSWK